MRNLFLSILCCILVSGCGRVVSPREKIEFNDGWEFALETPGEDLAWRSVRIPHDWAVEGDFSVDNPCGTGGGALPGGIGWYRKTFVADAAESDRLWRLEFDGVYMDSEVVLNGVSLGVRPYGYISFGYDITPYLKWGEKNELVVRVDNSLQPNSRWYSGCGIYRNVWLVKTNPVRIAPNGTYVVCQDDSFVVKTELLTEGDGAENVVLRQIVKDANGKTVGQVEDVVAVDEAASLSQVVGVRAPQLWSVDSPYLYTVVTEVEAEDGELLDRYETRTGFRTFEFDA